MTNSDSQTSLTVDLDELSTPTQNTPPLSDLLREVVVTKLHQNDSFLEAVIASFKSNFVSSTEILLSLYESRSLGTDFQDFKSSITVQLVWQGHDQPSWQLYMDIPIGCRHLVNDFNRKNRLE